MSGIRSNLFTIEAKTVKMKSLAADVRKKRLTNVLRRALSIQRRDDFTVSSTRRRLNDRRKFFVRIFCEKPAKKFDGEGVKERKKIFI